MHLRSYLPANHRLQAVDIKEDLISINNAVNPYDQSSYQADYCYSQDYRNYQHCNSFSNLAVVYLTYSYYEK